jgi:hypothetical protein
VTERRRADQRNRLDQVGADQLPGAQARVEHQQQHDDQRAGPDRGHPDDHAADDADHDRRQDLHRDRAGAGVPVPTVPEPPRSPVPPQVEQPRRTS